MQNKDSLQAIFTLLLQVGGYLVMADESGEEFVVIQKKQFDRELSARGDTEFQLVLPEPDPVDEINREIASTVYEDEEGLTVRFEPLRGDLPPELQD